MSWIRFGCAARNAHPTSGACSCYMLKAPSTNARPRRTTRTTHPNEFGYHERQRTYGFFDVSRPATPISVVATRKTLTSDDQQEQHCKVLVADACGDPNPRATMMSCCRVQWSSFSQESSNKYGEAVWHRSHAPADGCNTYRFDWEDDGLLVETI